MWIFAAAGEIIGNPTLVKQYVYLTPVHLKSAIKVLDRKPVCYNDATTDLIMLQKTLYGMIYKG